MRDLLLRIYRTLFATFGPQHWWPGDSTEEIIIGAILTQNTNWANVEKAIRNLKSANTLSLRKIAQMDESAVAELIKPSGYFRIKARRLMATARLFAGAASADFTIWRRRNLRALRQTLLDTHGIGNETADSILLYAFGRPTFVVDAYTMRFGARHGLWREGANYDDVKSAFESALPRSARIYNEYHALLVRLGKTYCKSRPICYECPLLSRQFFATQESFATQKKRC